MASSHDLSRRRFVILQHDHPFPHWDFLLELADCAATWRLLRLPVAGEPIPAERIANHRKHYLSYEGPVSGQRGTVITVESGTYLGTIHDDTEFELRLFDTPFAACANLDFDSARQARWHFRLR